MPTERRGCFYLIMFGIVIAALFALMEAFRMLVTTQQQMEEDRKALETHSPWLHQGNSADRPASRPALRPAVRPADRQIPYPEKKP